MGSGVGPPLPTTTAIVQVGRVERGRRKPRTRRSPALAAAAVTEMRPQGGERGRSDACRVRPPLAPLIAVAAAGLRPVARPSAVPASHTRREASTEPRARLIPVV